MDDKNVAKIESKLRHFHDQINLQYTSEINYSLLTDEERVTEQIMKSAVQAPIQQEEESDLSENSKEIKLLTSKIVKTAKLNAFVGDKIFAEVVVEEIEKIKNKKKAKFRHVQFLK
ncbi:Hypothetical_protein [Hexamita inflata]|uniref:Hypothetical_protein n=1 Tax=Hexamita inflata TaxID=28002 RepID=A0AA86P495_9EUKA|nr:Hypothetical protein HINF_LOCUS17587 [Hexamita inflata]